MGETVFLSRYDMKADAEGECFVNPEATLERKEDRLHTLWVTKEEEVVRATILAAGEWELQTASSLLRKHWFPTLSVVEELDPDLDKDRLADEAEKLLDKIRRRGGAARRRLKPPWEYDRDPLQAPNPDIAEPHRAMVGQ